MKTRLFFGLIALVGALSSCSNEDDSQPDDSISDEKSSISVLFTVPAQGDETVVPHYAVLSIEKDGTENIYTDTTVAVSSSATGFNTEALELDFGVYSLVKFVVYDASDRVVVATPYHGSEKAEGLTDLLPLEATVCCETPVLLHTDVLHVTEGADAPLFGYAEGTFGIDGSNAYAPLLFRSEMTIGNAFYDSLNSQIKITALDGKENYWRAERSLNGVTLITVPLYYDHYKVEWTQWGSSYEMPLAKDDLYSEEVVVLSASRQARILTSETEYLWQPEGYRLESKTDYMYDTEGKLIQRIFYQKQADSEELILSMETFFEYEGDQVKRIRKLHNGLMVEQQTYHYLKDGRLKAIDLDGGGGSQIAEWIYDEGTGEFTGVQYSFENDHYFVYNYKIKNGNVVAEIYAGGTNGGGGSSNISYDRYINPYYQFNITDYFLRYTSKNNVNGKSSSYVGSFPTFVPKAYTYNYSQDGYPLEREIIYEGYKNSETSYRTKTVFSYQ